MMKKIVAKLVIIFVILFIASIAWGGFCAYYCSKSNDNYEELQQEFIGPDIIDSVMYDEELKQIYVCYYFSDYVNVYNEFGDFLWCVGIYARRGPSYALDDDKLLLSSMGYSYIYDAKSGAFLEETDNEEILYKYDEEYDEKIEEVLMKNKISFDSTQVYKEDSNGNLKTIVSRPKWHLLFSVKLFVVCALFSVLGIGFCILFGASNLYLESKEKAEFKNRKAMMIKNYYKINSIIQTLSALLIALFQGVFTLLPIIIFPHFIISNIVLSNMDNKLLFSEDEDTVIQFWKIVNIATLVIPIACLVIYIIIFGER